MWETSVRVWETSVRVWETSVRVLETSVRVLETSVRVWETSVRVWETSVRVWETSVRVWETILKKFVKVLKPATVEKRWLAVFIETSALGLAAGLELFQLGYTCIVAWCYSLPLFVTKRTIARSSSLGELHVCAGGLTF